MSRPSGPVPDAVAEVLVLGMGPAATAVACALDRLGHAVQVVGVPAGRGIEGVSGRTLGLLTAAELQSAAAVAGAAVRRSGEWAGRPAAEGAEHILDRAPFDAALAGELAARGIPLARSRVLEVGRCERGWRVRLSGAGTLAASVLVDARGRRAQRGGQRGPALLALGQAWNGVSQAAGTRILPSEEGWFWLAHDERRTWVQYVTRPNLARGAGSMRAVLERAIGGEPGIARLLAGAAPSGPVVARSATPRLAGGAAEPGWLRAGDAALVLDPLSGHGLHEALRSARVITACVHTVLCSPGAEAGARALRFAREWSEALWQQSLRAAGDFYATEAMRRGGAFWDATATEYQDALARAQPRPTPGLRTTRIEQRPVLAGDRIELRPVVVTAHHPRGIWQIDTVDILELREVLRGRPRAALEGIARRFARPAAAIDNAAAWLVRHGMLAESERPVA